MSNSFLATQGGLVTRSEFVKSGFYCIDTISCYTGDISTHPRLAPGPLQSLAVLWKIYC